MEQEILENVKLLLELTDGERDELLLFLIKDTADAVTEYCRIDFIPRQLYGLIAQIAARIYNLRVCADGGGRAVRSITEGERRVEFEGGGFGEVFDSFAARLKPFVNKSARLPSEVSDNEG